MSKPLLFFGTEDFSAQVFEALIDRGYTFAAAVTKPDSKRGRRQQLTPPRVKTVALERGIPVWQPERLRDIAEAITSSGVEHGILVSYGKIIPASILDLFRGGIINLHPSLLPRYRGPSPIETALKNGDAETGVSIMRLTPRMDAGPVYAQATIPLTGTETRPELYTRCAERGSELLIETLPSILDGTLVPRPQDEAAATYCRLLTKADGQLDPSQKTAPELEREIRAYLGFPKSRLSLRGQSIIALSSRVVNSKALDTLTVACRDTTWLEITSLVAPSGRTMSGQDFLRGYGR